MPRLPAMRSLMRPSCLSNSHRGTLALLASGIVFGSVGIFIERAGQPALVAVWCRCLLGGLTLTLWLAPRGRLALPRDRRDLAAILGCGLLMTASWACFFASLAWLSIGVATVVVHLQPLLVLAWLAAVPGEPVAPRRWGAGGVALLGITLVASTAFDTPGGAGRGVVIGLLLALASAVCYAGVGLVARGARLAPASLACWQCLVGTLALAWVPWDFPLPAPGAAWGWLAGLGVLHTGLAYLLLFDGLRRVGTARGALLQFAYPVAAVVIEAVVDARPIGPWQALGLALTCGALALDRRWSIVQGDGSGSAKTTKAPGETGGGEPGRSSPLSLPMPSGSAASPPAPVSTPTY